MRILEARTNEIANVISPRICLPPVRNWLINNSIVSPGFVVKIGRDASFLSALPASTNPAPVLELRKRVNGPRTPLFGYHETLGDRRKDRNARRTGVPASRKHANRKRRKLLSCVTTFHLSTIRSITRSIIEGNSFIHRN